MNTKKPISLFSQTDVEVPVAAPAYQQQSLFAAFDNTDDFAVHTPYRPDASCSYADGGDALDVENDILEIQDLSSSDGECEDDGRGGHKQKTIYIYIYIYIYIIKQTLILNSIFRFRRAYLDVAQYVQILNKYIRIMTKHIFLFTSLSSYLFLFLYI